MPGWDQARRIGRGLRPHVDAAASFACSDVNRSPSAPVNVAKAGYQRHRDGARDQAVFQGGDAFFFVPELRKFRFHVELLRSRLIIEPCRGAALAP
ncbi:hypothetical protein HMPREF2772_05895 [Achromobacter xylosoxidans]|nr:hypothetical protein HMPREF2772_05895 [Achromobacter xylosoxidans]